MGVKTYDPKDVDITFGGIPVKGWADGAFLRIVMDEDTFQKVVGTDGEVARSRNENQCCSCSFILMQTSDTNNLLSALYNLDIRANGGAGVVPMLVRDKGGNTLFTTDAAWIVKPPDQEFDKTAKSREWPIATGKPAIFVGGN